MSLHSIVEPAGTLATCWGLIGKDDKKPDIRNKAEETDPVPSDDTQLSAKTVHHR